MTAPGILILSGLLALACWTDVRSHRIPNRLVLAGTALGIAFNGLSAQGLGWLVPLEGLAAGLALLLPLYALRAMSAGDVKLMGMIGSFLGPVDVVGAALATFVIGGLLAVAVALSSGVARRMVRNVWHIVVGSAVSLACGAMPTAEAVGEPAARMAYGVAIAAGTAAFIAWQRFQG